MKKLLLFIIYFSLVSFVDADDNYIEINANYKDLDLRSALNEANDHFTYSGKPIHPGLLGEFINWVSDGGPPITTTVDIAAAADTNEYHEPVGIIKTAPHDQTKSFMPDDQSEFDIEYVITKESTSIGYVWLGRLRNGLHVVLLSESYRPGGGTMNREFIIFVTFELKQSYKPDGNRYNQLLMNIKREYPLGDRAYPMIKVYKELNKVVILESQFLKKPYTLEFKSE
jgi:hypothetical protein